MQRADLDIIDSLVLVPRVLMQASKGECSLADHPRLETLAHCASGRKGSILLFNSYPEMSRQGVKRES